MIRGGSPHPYLKNPQSRNMENINNKFRKHRIGELQCLQLARRIKFGVIAFSFTSLTFALFGLAVAAISFMALSFAGLAIIAKLYHQAERHWFMLCGLQDYVREQRAEEENRALRESTTRLSRPLVNTPPLAKAA